MNVFQMTRYHPCGTPYWDKVVSCNACAIKSTVLVSLVYVLADFQIKQTTHVTIIRTHMHLKERDVKSPNQMKSSFFRDNLSTR